MIVDIGYLSLILAFILAIYSVIAAAYGTRKDERWIASARNATMMTLPLIAISCAAIIASMLRNDYSVEYVWRVSSIEMPTYLKYTALWGGQAGSLLFWNLLLALFTTASMAFNWRKQKELIPYAIIIGSITQAFFLGLSAFVENPFTRLDFMPANGNGLNPLLRHPGMIIHPPMLYLGFVGFTIPYTFAMAALISGKLDDTWIKITRRWTLIAWLFLGLGLILGGRWAYDVLGWGGYWAWDPVENASLIPWLAGTAFLHSVMIQEKRNMFRMWNMFLIILTYCLVIYGTFMVRSGVISSVHSFAQSEIGPLFFVFISLMFIMSVYWLNRRRPELKAENSLSSFLSREAAFLYANFLFLAILAIVFLFTNYSILSELFIGEQIFIGPPVYERALAPLFLVLVFLMGVAPMTMWYRSSAKRLGISLLRPAALALLVPVALFIYGVRGFWPMIGVWVVSTSTILTLMEFWKGTRARMKKGEAPWTAFANLLSRNRRRYGGYWIHMGVLVMAFGIIGVEAYQQETQIRLDVGESVSLGRYEMVFLGVERFPGPDDLLITEATVDVYENGRYVDQLNPRSELYTRTGQPMTIPNARSTIMEDFYVLIINWEPTSADQATFRIYLNPMINWVWAGGLIFLFGTLIAAWPEAELAAKTVTRRQRRPAVATD